MTRTGAQAESHAQAQLKPGLTAGFVGPKIRVLWNLLSARMAAVLEPYGLSGGAFSTMALIAANPGCSQNELAASIGMDKSAVVAIIDELEARGLGSRTRQAHDRRRYALALTPEGVALMQQMLKSVAEAGQPMREALSAEEMEQLLSLLDRAHQALEAAPWPTVKR